jgi:predicted DCC family thiol-disulfide oxidoreductase YuxK
MVDKKRIHSKKAEENVKIIVFDGICNLCNRFVQFIIKRDSEAKFKFASLQSDFAERALKSAMFSFNRPDFMVYIRGNKIFSKSTAVLLIFKDLGGIWKCFYPLIIFPGSFRDYFYNIVARNRYHLFGKRDSCMIPSPKIKTRFIE